MTSKRVITISNRLPVSVKKNPPDSDDATLSFTPSVGGLATGLASLEHVEMQWIGWPGIAEDDMNESQKKEIIAYAESTQCTPVFLTEKQIDEFYLGFSNETIWPLFHYFFQYCQFNPDHYETYKQVNMLYAQKAIEIYKPGDIFWIHDYQLMLVPELIRKAIPRATIGFFLHIPFPSFELMRLLPWSGEIVKGLLGANLIGFHTYDYVRHFLSSVYRITGYSNALSKISLNDNRVVTVDAFPMGINYERFGDAVKQSDVQESLADLKRQFREDLRVILSVDRLDYTKGILDRLESFDLFLSNYPQYKRKVTLVVVAVPSREAVGTYVAMREDLERTTSRINGTHGELDWTPIRYLYRSIPFNELSALYNHADVALITPLRDGMNLVAKEFVAAQDASDPGVLVLSELAGAAHEMYEAVLVNPFDHLGVAIGIKTALEMNLVQRKTKNDVLQRRLKRYTVQKWAAEFLEGLDTHEHETAMKAVDQTVSNSFCSLYRKTSKRVILLNYDGTLVNFFRNPADAKPDQDILEILGTLSSDPCNKVVILSGRDRGTLKEWFGSMPIHLVAEHGAYICMAGDTEFSAQYEFRDEWKEAIRPVMDRFMDRTPGSYVEEKSSCLVWDCRWTDPEMAQERKTHLMDTLSSMTSNSYVGVFESHMSVEVSYVGVSNGKAVEKIIKEDDSDFVWFASDDTQLDVLPVLPDSDFCYTFKVGKGTSGAKYHVRSASKLRRLLRSLYQQ